MSKPVLTPEQLKALLIAAAIALAVTTAHPLYGFDPEAEQLRYENAALAAAMLEEDDTDFTDLDCELAEQQQADAETATLHDLEQVLTAHKGAAE